jgi:hypothetical protein
MYTTTKPQSQFAQVVVKSRHDQTPRENRPESLALEDENFSRTIDMRDIKIVVCAEAVVGNPVAYFESLPGRIDASAC